MVVWGGGGGGANELDLNMYTAGICSACGSAIFT